MVDPGFTDASTLQTLHIAIPETAITDQRMVTRVDNNIADKLATVPGVTSVGFAALAPMEDGGHGWSYIHAEGKIYAVIRRFGSTTTSLLAIFRPWALVWLQDAISPGRKSTTFGMR